MSDHPPGFPADRFVPVRRLGVGGGGEVWLAEGAEGQVAIKLASSSKACAALLREAALLDGLSHPYVAGLVDHDSDGRWLALEFVDGGPIHRWARGRSLSSIVEVVAQAAEAVAYLHANDIIHGDLKPGNVLVDGDQNPRLIDLGIAARPGEPSSAAFKGTLGYASPEQIRGEPLQPACDIYCLGALSYLLVTGRLPFRTDDPAALTWLPLKTLPEPPSSTRVRLPTQLDQLILRMLARHPGARPQDAAVLATTLRACLHGTPGEPVIGMHREREALRRLVVEAADGATAVAVVHGPRGSGRSTLIKEAVAAARRVDLVVLRPEPATEGTPRARWDALLTAARTRRGVVALEAEDPATAPFVVRMMSERIPGLALIRAAAPIGPLLALGARHVAPPRLTLEEVGALLDLAHEDRRSADEVLRHTGGLPGAVVDDLHRAALPDDLSEAERTLLQAMATGPVPIPDLAERLGMGEHAMLDIVEPLIDRGLIVESLDGSMLERTG